MCGIAGWINWEQDLKFKEGLLKQMVAKLTPRGPDAEGFWISKRAAFGHRRLIVIDPEGGGQPMAQMRWGETYCLIYNGELYNTDELRQELISYGYRFHGHSDTEVLLISFIQWEEKCVERLNGIYAFAVWRENKEELFMARDRLGVKPLFYTEREGGLLFASELKALLSHPAVPAELDAEGLAEIFALGPSRTPGHGVFRGINELRGGYSLSYGRKGLLLRQYWKLASRPHQDDLEATAFQVKYLLQDAVKRQLVADVPICTLLSGGLDSSAISAIAADHLVKTGRGTLDTYSVDFVDNNRFFRPSAFQPDTDGPWIKLISDYLSSKHRYITIDTPQLVASLEEATRARDLPGMADVDSSLMLFCREIKKGVTVGLSGESADEIFGGYPWFHREESLRTENFPWLTNLGERIKILDPDLIKKIRPLEYVAARYRQTLAEVPELKGEEPLEARRRELFYLNLIWFLATLLDRKDRMSMACGLEIRVPFCDHRLVEYVWNIPWVMKTCDGLGKGILRRALRGILPQEVLARKKSPYPKTHNPSYFHAVKQKLFRRLEQSTSPLRPLLNLRVLRDFVSRGGESSDQPWFGQLMTGPQMLAYLIQIDFWLREYQVKIN